MNDLITYENGNYILKQGVGRRLAEYEKIIKRLKEQEDELKNSIMTAMEECGVIKIDTDDVTVSYIAATARESFDSKKFKKDKPDLYDEYCNLKPVQASIRIKLKERK